MIAARSHEQLDAAHALLAGVTGATYRQFARRCATLLALVESGIDFTDREDVCRIAPSVLHDRLEAFVSSLNAFIARGSAQTADALPRVAIVGKPDAGKSTLSTHCWVGPEPWKVPLLGQRVTC